MSKYSNESWLLLVIVLACVIGGAFLWGDYKFDRAEGNYKSEIEELADGASEFHVMVANGKELKSQTHENFSQKSMKQYSAYIDAYIVVYRSNAEIAKSVLQDPKYSEYEYLGDIKDDLIVIKNYGDEVEEDLLSTNEFLKYMIAVYDAIDNEKLAQYDKRYSEGVEDYDLLTAGYAGVLDDLKLIEPPEYMASYHKTMLDYYSELWRLFVDLRSIKYELAAMKRSPDSYSDRVKDAMMLRQAENDDDFSELFRTNAYAVDSGYFVKFIPESFTVAGEQIFLAKEKVYLDALVEIEEYWKEVR